MSDTTQKTPDMQFTTRDDIVFTVTFKNADGTAKNITGWTGSYIFKQKYDAIQEGTEVVVNATVNGAAGEMTFTLSDSINLMSPGTWFCQLRIVETGNLRTTLKPGVATIDTCLFES
jgi:hypothetical protein